MYTHILTHRHKRAFRKEKLTIFNKMITLDIANSRIGKIILRREGFDGAK